VLIEKEAEKNEGAKSLRKSDRQANDVHIDGAGVGGIRVEKG
jgi:hypothetical protein